MKYICTLLITGITFISQAQESYVHDAMRKKYGDPQAQKGNDWMQNHMLNAKMEAQYTFPTSMTMHITNYDKGAVKSESDIQYFFNSSKNFFATNAEDSRRKKKNDDMLMIYDYNNNTMLMLNQTEKTGMAININAFRSQESIDKRSTDKPAKDYKSSTKCNKTGKTKTIQGYKCEEYVCTDDERNTRTEMWIAPKISVNMAQSAARGPLAAFYRGGQNYTGMMMEANLYKDGQLETTTQVTKLDEKANLVVKPTDYKLNH
ncbi:DUF4412 domain-containing protein [Chitinophagaceae bacterium MMS25-I14]